MTDEADTTSDVKLDDEDARLLDARWQQPMAAMAIDWSTHGEELMTHLHDGLSENGVTGFSLRRWGLTIGGELCVMTPRGVEGRLLMVRTTADNVVRFWVLGDDEEGPSDATLEPWNKAFQALVERFGKTSEAVQWEAVIGPAPSRMGGDARVLESTCRVGPFELEGVPHVYWESVKTGLSTCSTFRSCPLIVRGTSVALNRSAALVVAKEQLYDLCALLSVEWEQCSPWVLRDDPYDSKRYVPMQEPFLRPDFGGSRASRCGGRGRPAAS